jgi:hypothetical protein
MLRHPKKRRERLYSCIVVDVVAVDVDVCFVDMVDVR